MQYNLSNNLGHVLDSFSASLTVCNNAKTFFVLFVFCSFFCLFLVFVSLFESAGAVT